jgi:rhamnosyltransferase
MSAPEPTSFPSDGTRLIVYVAGNDAAAIDEYVFLAVGALREHASRSVVALSKEPTASDRLRLAALVDDIAAPLRPGRAALGAMLDGMERDGMRYDEVVITDDSWFGPVSSLQPVFARMDPIAAHAWTMTPTARRGAAAWVAVRRARDAPSTWTELLPAVDTVIAAGTATAAAPRTSGATSTATGLEVAEAFPEARYPGRDPVVLDSHRLLADGCPLVSRRIFASPPAYLDRHAVIGKALLDEVSAQGYPAEAILQHLARRVAPHQLNASLGLLTVTRGRGPEHPSGLRTLVLAHFAQDADPGELLRRVALVPGGAAIVATTCTPADAGRIRGLLMDARSGLHGDIEVRPLPPTADEVSAVFVGCRDLLLDGHHDVVIKLHSGRLTGPSANARRYLARHLWENLLATPDHAAEVVELFREPGLGILFPPTPHIGHDTLGSGWRGMRADAEGLARMLKIRVPLGDRPLMPVGGMWIARPSAVRIIAEHPWQWEDYAAAAGSPGLGRAQESILAHAAGELGFHVRTVLTSRNAAISHAPLEFKMDQLASTTPGFPVDQIGLLHRLGWVGSGSALDFARMHLRANRAPLVRRFPFLDRSAPRPGASGGFGERDDSGDIGETST